jgi:hypothetical protein
VGAPFRRFFADGLHWVALCGLVIGYALYGAADARADGVLTQSEQAYGDIYGESVICSTIDAYPSVGGVMGVTEALIKDGLPGDSAADVLNYSVKTYCPRHWPLLMQIGRAARAGGSV